jgi:small subunit ribosomal protein S2
MSTDTKSIRTKPASPQALPGLVELLEAGVHFGHERSKQNPKMKHHIFTQRNRIAILDLEKTQAALQVAADFAHTVASNLRHEILFVGTKRQARQIVREQAETAGMPYVTRRWLGGTLTNFATIQKSVEKLEELKKISQEKQVKFTKKEQAVRQKEISRLESVLEGIKSLKTMPKALFIVGAYDEKIAVHEARKMGIPTIGIVDTNADPDLIDYPIPANDDAVRSLQLIVKTITNAIVAARSGQGPGQREQKGGSTASEV